MISELYDAEWMVISRTIVTEFYDRNNKELNQALHLVHVLNLHTDLCYETTNMNRFCIGGAWCSIVSNLELKTQ
jgi:hypothetical protein